MFNAFWYNIDFARTDEDVAVSKINTQHALYHDKGFVGFRMRVPDKVTRYFHDFELVVVHLRNNFWLPVSVEERGKIRWKALPAGDREVRDYLQDAIKSNVLSGKCIVKGAVEEQGLNMAMKRWLSEEETAFKNIFGRKQVRNAQDRALAEHVIHEIRESGLEYRWQRVHGAVCNHPSR